VPPKGRAAVAAMSPKDELRPPRASDSRPLPPVPSVPRGLVYALVLTTGVLLIFLVLVALRWRSGT
jgi:hypothetical protein